MAIKNFTDFPSKTTFLKNYDVFVGHNDEGTSEFTISYSRLIENLAYLFPLRYDFIYSIPAGLDFQFTKNGNHTYLNINTDYEGEAEFLTQYTDEGNTVRVLNQKNITSFTFLNAPENCIIEASGSSGFTSLSSVTFGGGMQRINLGGCGNISELNYSSSNILHILFCNNNKITNLDNLELLSGLVTLECNNNQLTTLDVTSLTNLEVLKCQRNQLTTLNISNLSNLKTIFANFNQLTELDCSSLTQITVLNVNDNQLTDIDVSNFSASNFFFFLAENNQLTETTVNNILIKLDSFNTNGGNPTNPRTIRLQGGTNASPTGDGLTAKANLISRAWVVETN